MHKLKVLIYIIVLLSFASIGFAATNEVKTLPGENDIFTIAFNVTGLKKESKDIFSKDDLKSKLSKAFYIGRYSTQLKYPFDEHYWCQDGIVVLKNKAVFSFTILEEMNEAKPEIYMLVYFVDGKGMYLYKLAK